MTLAVKTWLVDGQTNFPGQLARLMYRSATRNGQGIVEIGDLRVEELDVPGTAVVVRDGAFTVRGAEEVWQGSYWGYNLGDEQVTLTATGSSGPRSDLVWLQIQDSTVAGAGWSGDPDTDPKAYFVVTEGVSANTTDVPAGKSGIPLARIDRPASTGTVTQDDIVDLRQMADPRELTSQLVVKGFWGDSEDATDEVGNVVAPDWEVFMNGAEWDIDVPTWAAQMVISYTFYGLQFDKPGANSEARGAFRVNWAGTGYDPDDFWIRGDVAKYTRVACGGANGQGGGIPVPQAIRGTTQHLQIEGQGYSTAQTGRLGADGGSVLVVTYTFREVPRYDVVDRSPA